MATIPGFIASTTSDTTSFTTDGGVTTSSYIFTGANIGAVSPATTTSTSNITSSSSYIFTPSSLISISFGGLTQSSAGEGTSLVNIPSVGQIYPLIDAVNG